MKLIKYLFTAMVAITLASCEIPKLPVYDKLDSIANTTWQSYDNIDNVDTYYDVLFFESDGAMKGYKDLERKEQISTRNFTYTFTPAMGQRVGQVYVAFEDGQRYSGILIHKGELQVNYEDVYVIQLYEVDDNGEIIYNENGNIHSSILLWMKEK